MINEALIFRGEGLYRVGLEYFFQDPLIESITKKDVLDAYTEQKIFFDTIIDISKGKVEEFSNDMVIDLIKQERLLYPKVEKGLTLMIGMVKDMYGDRRGEALIKELNNLILEA